LDGLLFVKDLGSANGTFLNGKQIVESRVKRGDELRFDALSFGVIGPADDLAKTTVRGPINRPTAISLDLASAKPATKAPSRDVPNNNVLDRSVRTSSSKRSSQPDQEEPVHYGKHSMAILVVLVVIVLTALYLKGG
jgi:pSer/pThr/pTyr-binding forkhead associated (FHA) protein